MKQKIVLIVSIAVGILAAVLTRAYLASKDAEMQKMKEEFIKNHETTMVLCFARDVSSGTALAESDLGEIKVPARGLRGQALTKKDLQHVLNHKVLVPHKERDILFWSDIEGGNPAAGGLAADINKKKRAVSINCTGAAAVSGMVKPSDHVDVIASYATPKIVEGTMIQELSTRTILQNVLVLATGKETAKSALARNDAFGGGGTYSTVTLEVSPREAELLVFYEQIKGRLFLALRNRDDTYYVKDLPQIDIKKIGETIEDLNKQRQDELNGGY